MMQTAASDAARDLPTPYIAPRLRTYANMPPPTVCQCLEEPHHGRCAVHRIAMAVPEEAIAERVFSSLYWMYEGLGLIHGLASLGVDVRANNAWGMIKLHGDATEREKAEKRFRYFRPGFRATCTGS